MSTSPPLESGIALRDEDHFDPDHDDHRDDSLHADAESQNLLSNGTGGDVRHDPDDGDDEDDDPSSDEDDENAAPPGKTYRVGGGKLKLMEKGMAQYVAYVERKLAKQKREEAKT